MYILYRKCKKYPFLKVRSGFGLEIPVLAGKKNGCGMWILTTTSYNTITLIQRQVDEHVYNEHPAQFQCDVCQQIFKSAYKLNYHKTSKKFCRRIHSSSENSNSSDSSITKSYLCSNCGAEFTRRQNLNKHIRYNCKPLGMSLFRVYKDI